ncbi:TRAP transporter small permease [Martelella soudanensis]|uniref:TRAP transporter small permease n=1 Tax=unclassified Martelella TaxID=2629616 RepID=UPI0015DF7EEE|nr:MULTISPECIES: TRAP transporter small permease [unclassified Martelella]
MIRMLRRFLKVISTIEKAIVILTFSAVLAALSMDVIGREVFAQGLFGSVKFAVYALILCAMAGFGLATASGAHLRPKFLDFVTQGRAEMPARRAGRVASAAILLFLAWGALNMVLFSRMIGDRDLTLGWLIWPVQMVLPVAFVISALRHLIYAAFPELGPAEEEQTE